MPLTEKRFGVSGIAIQGVAIAFYCILLVREHMDTQWVRGSTEPLHGINKCLGQASLALTLGGASIALIGMTFDKDRLVGILAICLVIPILVFMALLQGIW